MPPETQERNPADVMMHGTDEEKAALSKRGIVDVSPEAKYANEDSERNPADVIVDGTDEEKEALRERGVSEKNLSPGAVDEAAAKGKGQSAKSKE